MKKIIIACLLIASGASIKAQHDVSLDVLSFGFERWGLGYEYALNSNNSIGINFNMTSKNLFHDQIPDNPFYALADGGEYKYTEMNIIPEYKWFATPNKGNDGIYMGAYAKFRTSKASDNTYTDTTGGVWTFQKTDVSTSGLALGALIGYKWKSSGAFFMEATFGVGRFIMNNVSYSSAAAEDDPNFNEDDYTPYIGNSMPVDLRIAGKIGFRFGGGGE